MLAARRRTEGQGGAEKAKENPNFELFCCHKKEKKGGQTKNETHLQQFRDFFSSGRVCFDFCSSAPVFFWAGVLDFS